MNSRIKAYRFRLPASLLGGGMVGLLMAAYPYLPVWSPGELGHLRAYLLEMIMSVLGRVLSVPAMRGLHSPAGIVFLFILLGMALGVLAGLVRKRDQSLFRTLIFSIAGASALFSLSFLVAWAKTLLFYPSSTMFSISGAIALAVSALVSGLLGFILFFVLKQNRTISLTVLALILLATASVFLLPQRSPSAGGTEAPSQVIVIGIDAAHWGVMMPLARQGRLPNVQRLLNEGTYGDLRATLKVESPVIWTSIATGVRMEKHGIRGFVIRRKDTGELLPISVSYRQVDALWDIASRHGKTTDVVGWFGSWPAEEVRGCYVSVRLGFKDLGMRVYPPQRLAEIESLLPPETSLDTSSLTRIGVHLLAEDKPDLAMIYFWSLDPLQHQLWKFHAARLGSGLVPWVVGSPPPQKVDTLGSKIENEYVRMDGVIGDLIRAAQDRAAVFILSDHGMGLGRGPVTFNLQLLLEKLGWFFLQPDSQAVDWTRTLVFDATQHLQPRYLSHDFMLNVRKGSPLQRTPALFPPADFLQKVQKTLTDLRTLSGEKVLRKIQRSKDAASGLDKIVVWPNLRLSPEDEIAIGADKVRVESILSSEGLSGMHRLEGMFLAKGPGIKSGYRVKDASILDITPTVLYFLGLPQARDMEGRLLTSIIDPAYLRKNPVRWISSHESGRPRKIQIQEKSTADEKTLEMLRTLGYIH